VYINEDEGDRRQLERNVKRKPEIGINEFLSRRFLFFSRLGNFLPPWGIEDAV